MNRGLEERFLPVWVTPRATKNEILGYREGILWIRVDAAPVKGEANRLCCHILATALGVSPSQVEIVSGHQSRRKRFKIKDINPATFSNWESRQRKLG